MRNSKRVISKSKTYGFNPWVDQVDAISQIMAETEEKAESVVLRKLIDEALAARRRKTSGSEMSAPPPVQGLSETLQTVQTLLLKLIRQGESSLRIQDVNLALLQDTLAEAYAGRKVSWSLSGPGLKEKGLSTSEIAKRFESETAEARNHAYSVAKQIKKSQPPKG